MSSLSAAETNLTLYLGILLRLQNYSHPSRNYYARTCCYAGSKSQSLMILSVGFQLYIITVLKIVQLSFIVLMDYAGATALKMSDPKRSSRGAAVERENNK